MFDLAGIFPGKTAMVNVQKCGTKDRREHNTSVAILFCDVDYAHHHNIPDAFYQNQF